MSTTKTMSVRDYLELSSRLISQASGTIKSVQAYSDLAGQFMEVLQAYESDVPGEKGIFVLELEDNETRLKGNALTVQVEYEMFPRGAYGASLS